MVFSGSRFGHLSEALKIMAMYSRLFEFIAEVGGEGFWG
jgi:hypothetical protein